MNKDLSYFMRDEMKNEQIFIVPGPSTICGENDIPINLEIKKLSQEQINKIHDLYTNKKYLKDKKGNFVVQNGQAITEINKDINKITNHILVDSLIYPNLRDMKLMEYFGEVDITNMPARVFGGAGELAYVNQKILEVLGLRESSDTDETEIDDAKN